MPQLSNALFLSALFAMAHGAHASIPRGHESIVNFDKGSGSVQFVAIGHPSALRIVGNGAAPQGALTVEGKKVHGTLSFNLNSLDTGIALRTHHMKEKYLQTDKFAEAKLTLTQMTLPQTLSAKNFSVDHVPFTGVLSLHGVQRPVTGSAKIQKSGTQLSMNAKFGLKVSDYNIAIPSFAGITMADHVQVSVADSAPVVAMAQPARRKHWHKRHR